MNVAHKCTLIDTWLALRSLNWSQSVLKMHVAYIAHNTHKDSQGPINHFIVKKFVPILVAIFSIGNVRKLVYVSPSYIRKRGKNYYSQEWTK